MVTQDELLRLNAALLFIESILGAATALPPTVSDLAWAAHSYIQSVTLPDYPPSGEAPMLFCKLQTQAASAEASRRAT